MDIDHKQAARNKHRASQQKKRGRGRPRGSGRGRPQGERSTRESTQPSLHQYIRLPGNDDHGPSLDRMEEDAPPDLSKNWKYLLSMGRFVPKRQSTQRQVIHSFRSSLAGSPVQQEFKYQEEKIWDQYSQAQLSSGKQGLDHVIQCLNTLPLSALLDLDEEEDSSLLSVLSSSEAPRPTAPTKSNIPDDTFAAELIRRAQIESTHTAKEAPRPDPKPVKEEEGSPPAPSEEVPEDEDALLEDILGTNNDKPIIERPNEEHATNPTNTTNDEEDLEDWLDSVL